MIITQMSLPRRTFLRGIGAAVALPLLDAMVPAVSAMSRTAANPVRRLGCIYIPNGAYHAAWKPEGSGRDFAFSPTLEPLAPFRDRVVVVSNLAHRQLESLGDGGGDHSRASAGWLSGVHAKRTEGADVHVATTADQIAARVIGRETPLSSLEVALDATEILGHCDVGYSCAYMNNISWRSPTTPNPGERNPRAVFERLFGEGDSAAERLQEMRVDRSLLDSVTEEVGRLKTRLGAHDRRRVAEYLDAIRETERRIQMTERHNRADVEVPDRPIGIPEDFGTHAKLMIDLQVLAYQADLTRVTTFAFGHEASYRTFPAIGVNDPHHSLSPPPEQRREAGQAGQGEPPPHRDAGLLPGAGCRASPDGDGTLLDHALLLYGSGLSDGNLHNHSPLPTIVAGGAAGRCQGRAAPGVPRRDADVEPAAEHARHGGACRQTDSETARAR